MVGLLIVVGVVAVLVAPACAALLYSRLVRLRNPADNAWSRVDVRLGRRCI